MTNERMVTHYCQGCVDRQATIKRLAAEMQLDVKYLGQDGPRSEAI